MGRRNQVGLDVPTPHADRITERWSGASRPQTTQVERDQADLMLDAPPADRLLQVAWTYLDRFRTEVTPSIYYFWMNTAEPPFDEMDVRRAVDYAIDPARLSGSTAA